MHGNLMEIILEKKIIAIIRGVSPGDIQAVADALLAGGVALMEVTFDHSRPGGVDETLESLSLLREKFSDRVAVGAGTVLTPGQVQAAAQCGAQYIISPNMDEAVIDKTRELDLISIPGALTPSEIVQAHKQGAHIVKLFPAGLWGTDYIKAVRAPLAHIPMAAVGGVDAETIPDFLAAGVACFGVGSNLVDAKKVAAGDFASITAGALAMSEKIPAVKT